MKAELEKVENNLAELRIEVEAEEVDKAVDKAYRKLVKETDIPGFRKGKAPRQILENHLGKEPLYREALDYVIPDAYDEAVKETGISPIDKPEINIEQLEEGNPLIFKLNVEVRPEVELGDYKSLDIEKPETEVTEEDVDEHLKALQQRHARLVTVLDPKSPVQDGDVAVIDFKGYIDGETFSGGIEEDYSLEVGSGTFISDFEEQLKGAKAGETRNIVVNFPKEYTNKKLAGKEATFEVKVKEIKRKELLPLDDEFAKDVSEFDTLDELKEDAREKLKEQAEKNVRDQIKDRVIKKAVENAEVEVPDTLVEKRIDAHINRLEERLKSQGYDLDMYCNAAETSKDELREKYREQAEESVRTDLVMEEIATKEDIQINEDDIFEEIEKLAQEYNESTENIQKALQTKDNIEALSYGILMDKTIKFLIDNSRVKGDDKDRGTDDQDADSENTAEAAE